MVNELSFFLKQMRRRWGMSQQDLADRSGVGIGFIRSIEQGKESLMMDKVNQVLSVFDCKMSPSIKDENCVLSAEFAMAEDFVRVARSSYDMYASVMILPHSSVVKLVPFWKRVMFSWMTACLDFSYKHLFVASSKGFGLPVSPHYDLLLDMLERPSVADELPLPLNGKRRLIERKDWIAAMVRSGLSKKDAELVLEWIISNCDNFKKKILSSHLDSSLKMESVKRITYNRLLLMSVL